MKKFLPAIVSSLIWMFCVASLPAELTAQQSSPIDTVRILEQPGTRPYECCFTFIVTNRHRSDVTISEFRTRIISGNEKGMFLPGQAGSPIDWSIFLNSRDIAWISQTFAAEIDSGESLTSFRACVRDTGVYRIVWETYGFDGLLSQDTLVLVCSSRDNCDEAFFKPTPSLTRCGFDIDLLNQNGAEKEVNDFHLLILTPDYTFDTAGMRFPPGWRLDQFKGNAISWKTTTAGLSFGEFAETFRVFVKSQGSPVVQIAWWTTNFGDQICRDSLILNCGLTAPDTLFARPAIIGADTCCRDFLLINSHAPHSGLKRFRISMPANTHVTAPSALPSGWSYTINSAHDTLAIEIDSLLAFGDSVVFSGICFEGDLSLSDTIPFGWRTEYDGLNVTEGIGMIPCFRKVVYCDSVSAIVDSSLVALDRCITLNVANRNSRHDQITLVTAKISNPGLLHKILRAKAPNGWSIDQVTPDSVIFHRGILDAGRNQNGFEFCIDIDTNAYDPLTITWTTWANTLRPICTGEIQVKADGVRACDSVVFAENDQSIDPLCCFDVTFYNRNERGLPIEAMVLRIPRIDLIFDSADASGPWRIGTGFFPSVRVDYVGSALQAGDSVTFRFCVNAAAEKNRPITFKVVWQTYSGGQVICFDTVSVTCKGAKGDCDTIEATREQVPDGGCIAYYRIKNTHTPTGPINNVEFNILSGDANFVSGEVNGTASAFSQVSLTPKKLIFRGGSIAPGEAAEEFHLNYDVDSDREIVMEICTYEDDLSLCCTLDTIHCSFLGVEDEEATTGALSHTVLPNPFGDRTEFRYRMERAGGVTLVLLDEAGKEVRRYNEGLQEAGTHSLVVQAGELPSGVYYYVLQAGAERGRGKVIVVR